MLKYYDTMKGDSAMASSLAVKLRSRGQVWNWEKDGCVQINGIEYRAPK